MDMWVWSKLSAMRWMDAWEERFFGNQNAVITELKGGKSLRVEVYTEEKAEAEAIAAQFGGSVRELKSRNWAEHKGAISPPLTIRGAFLITQESDPKKLAKLRVGAGKKEVITIPAEMAFGTGDHPTTSTVLRFLVDETRGREKGWNFLDLGTGSGILAIAAYKLGAKEIVALDYDPKAVEVASENMKRNDVDGVEIGEADVTTWKNRKRYEAIAANLFSDVLLQTLPRMSAWLAQNGVVFLSGILAPQWDAVREKAEACGFVVEKHLKKGKWVTAKLRLGEK